MTYEVNGEYSYQPKCNLVPENVTECDRHVSRQRDIPYQSDN
jgi:hypothetical protein